MLTRVMRAVTEFHEKHKFDVGVALTPVTGYGGSGALAQAGEILIVLSKAWSDGTTQPGLEQPFDARLLRASLMLEELGELLVAMGRCDEVATLDGLTDLTYVVAGSAVSFGLPLSEAFAEVHRSNMTKETREDDDTRLRRKGGGYEPPDLERVLRESKAR